MIDFNVIYLSNVDEIKSYFENIQENKIRVIVSLPMSGGNADDIIRKQKEIINKLKEIDPRCELLDTFNKAVPGSLNKKQLRIWCLGDSLRLMAFADFVIFVSDFKKAKGCLVEHQICCSYEMPFAHESALERK